MAQNNNVTNPNATIHEESPNIPTTFGMDDLKKLIADMLKEESNKLLSSTSQTTRDIDEPIGVRSNIEDMDRIPDVVKGLREFSGQSGQFSSWKKSVDRILKVYEHLRGTPKYYGMLNVIRNKITGEADIALESYNTPLNWEKIAKCLTLHYADKRDLGTLEYQMTTLVQKNDTIPEFYQTVYHHLSLILNKLSSMEMSQESLDIMTKSYRDKALDTFIRGLKGDLPRLLSMKEPIDLPQALHLCLKLQNVDYRIQHSHGNVKGVQYPKAAPIQPKINQFPIDNPKMNFYPQLLNNPQRITRPDFQRQNQHFYQMPRPFFRNNVFDPPRPLPRLEPMEMQRPFFRNNDFNPPRPLPRAEPMEIDNSTNFRRINSNNKVQAEQFANKRPLSHQTQVPGKFQRVFHTEQDTGELTNEEQYLQEIANYDEHCEQTLNDYLEPQENPVLEEPDAVYFLD